MPVCILRVPIARQILMVFMIILNHFSGGTQIFLLYIIEAILHEHVEVIELSNVRL